MTVWEKTIVNLQKGYVKLTSFAVQFSERVKSEITIIRLKMEIDEERDKMREQYSAIGKKLIEMQESGELPASFELFFKNSEIAAALEKIERIRKDLDILQDDLRQESEVLKQAASDTGERSS